MNRIVLTEKDFESLLQNKLKFNDITFSEPDFVSLIKGEVVQIGDNSIILQDIGYYKILDLVDKYLK